MGMNAFEDSVLPAITTTHTSTCLAEPHTIETVVSSDSDASYTPSCSPPPLALAGRSIATTGVARPRGRRIRRKPRIPHSHEHTPEPLEPSKRNLSVFKQAEDGAFLRLFAREIVDRKWLLTKDVLRHAKSLADEMEKEGHIWCKVGVVRNDAIASGTHKHQEAYQQLSYPVRSY